MFFLVGCNVTNDDAGDNLVDIDPLSLTGEPLVVYEKSTEMQDTQGEESTDEESRSNLTEGQESQREETIDGESRSNMTERQDTQGEEPGGEGSESNLTEGTEYEHIGGRVEGCYDNPNKPVKDQNYNVGPPRYERKEEAD